MFEYRAKQGAAGPGAPGESRLVGSLREASNGADTLVSPFARVELPVHTSNEIEVQFRPRPQPEPARLVRPTALTRPHAAVNCEMATTSQAT